MTDEGGVAVFVKIGFIFWVRRLALFRVSRLYSAGCMVFGHADPEKKGLRQPGSFICGKEQNPGGLADVVEIGGEKPQGYGTP
jgi:hypothetical protein